MSKRPAKFFQAGGALNSNMPSYVKRRADDELFEKILEGELCYLLTPRQLGKSSLIFSTERRCIERGFDTTFVDLSEIGAVIRSEMDSWYIGILNKVREDLELDINPAEWWESKRQPAPQRFLDFLRLVADNFVEERLVLFFDEVDSTLRLDFRADFFSAIRSVVNAQARDKTFTKLTFVLVGVALPGDLINDTQRTPFNVGDEIPLNDLSMEEAAPFIDGLAETYPNQAREIFERIFYWTNGQPYLTQRLCVEVLNSNQPDFTDSEIDALVLETFTGATHKDTNTRDIEGLILSFPRKNRILRTYQSIFRGESVAEKQNNTDQARLKLSGLVKIQDGYLIVRNRLYSYIFNNHWIKRNIDSQLAVYSVITSLSLIVVLLLGVLGYENWRERQAENAFFKLSGSQDGNDRVEAFQEILCQFEPPYVGASHSDLAIQGLSSLREPEEQAALFDHQKYLEGRNCLVRAIEGSAVALTDHSTETKHIKTTWLLRAMHEQLNLYIEEKKLAEGPEVSLERGLEDWINGRESFDNEEFQQATILYTKALTTTVNNIEPMFGPADKVNHGVLFDRAKAYVALGNFDAALVDLNKVAGNASAFEEIGGEIVDRAVEEIIEPITGSDVPVDDSDRVTTIKLEPNDDSENIDSGTDSESPEAILVGPGSSSAVEAIETEFNRSQARSIIVRDYVRSNEALSNYLETANLDGLENVKIFVETAVPTEESETPATPTAQATETPIPTEEATPEATEDVVVEPPTETPIPPTQTPTPAMDTVVQAIANTSIFECTSTSSSQPGFIRAGDEVETVIGINSTGRWLNVNHNGAEGWAFIDGFLSISPEFFATIPTVAEPVCATPTPTTVPLPADNRAYYIQESGFPNREGGGEWSFTFRVNVPDSGSYGVQIGDGFYSSTIAPFQGGNAGAGRQLYEVQVRGIACQQDLNQDLFISRLGVSIPIVNQTSGNVNRAISAVSPCK